MPETLAWVLVVPAALVAFLYADALQLAFGAFGPPPRIMVERLISIGTVAAAIALWGYRHNHDGQTGKSALLRIAILASIAAIAYIVILVRGRDITTRNVVFRGSSIDIAATIYAPRTMGRHPAVVFVPGSAPLKRGFYSLWAEKLARSGIVSIVPDKRGVGGTGGQFERHDNTSQANLDLLAGDAVAALNFAVGLPNVDSACVGLFGLSQGGWVAPIAATRSTRARYLMMVTAPAVSVHEEGVWSRLRGDDHEGATMSREAAERVIDTVTPRGVDARTSLAALSIPQLWLFGSDDNSIPTGRSVAVLDSLRSGGKPIETRTFARTGHILFTRAGGVLPHAVDSSWQAIDAWSREHLRCASP